MHPLNEDGSFKEIQVYGKSIKGKALYDVLDSYVRKAFVAVNEEEREKGRDILWFIWSSPNSPLFGKNKMATFERYFLEAKETHEEKKNPYYYFLEKEETANRILEEFQVTGDCRHIVNGHVPVHHTEGESRLNAEGKSWMIDGDFPGLIKKKQGLQGIL